MQTPDTLNIPSSYAIVLFSLMMSLLIWIIKTLGDLKSALFGIEGKNGMRGDLKELKDDVKKIKDTVELHGNDIIRLQEQRRKDKYNEH